MTIPAKLKPARIEISFVFGSLPVLESEGDANYWQFVERVSEALEPDDFHEWMLVKTIVDCDWQNMRYERNRARWVDLRRVEALANILRSILEKDTIQHSREHDAEELAQDYFTDPETKKAISQHLFDYGLSEESIDAEATRLCMQELTQINRLVEANERRRSFALRDLEFYRECKRLRKVNRKEPPLIEEKALQLRSD